MILFGAGSAIIKPVSGNLAANPTPQILGVMQDCQVEVSRSTKTLYGQQQSPVAVATAEHKYTGKSKFANLFGKQFSDYVFGQPTSGTYRNAQLSESHTIPTTPFQITVAPPSSGVYVEDLGVYNGVTGLSLV